MTDWMKKMNKMEGAVDGTENPYAEGSVLRSTSPSLNEIFGKGAGLPFGFTMISYGPPKSGKSLIANAFIAGLHRDYPDAIAVKFNTEMREKAQTGAFMDMWGIDRKRYMGFDVNEPQFIFDHITGPLTEMVEAGMPLKLIIIDSMEGIEGVKAANKESILGHTMGDHALTIGEGLKRILPFIRRNNIAVICTSHVRANFSGGPHGPKTKMAGGYAQKHWFEYYVEVKRAGAAEDKKDLSGKKFEDTGKKDFKRDNEITGHKVWTKMKESSTGVAGRSGQFTFNYNSGIINDYEEVYKLACNYGFIEKPNNTSHIYNGQSFNGKLKMAEFIRDNAEAKADLLEKIYRANDVVDTKDIKDLDS